MTSSFNSRLGTSPEEGIKAPVSAATTGDITLSGEQTVDSIALVDSDRCLVMNQTDDTENGIYDVSAGAWTRSKDFSSAQDVVNGVLILDTNGVGSLYRANFSGAYDPGTTAMTIAVMVVSGSETGVRNGSGAPSAGTGIDGDFYIDTTAWDIYGPKAAGAWPAGASLIGPTGAGTPGDDGLFAGTEATVTPATGDLIPGQDISDSDNPKRFTLLSMLQLMLGLSNAWTAVQSFVGLTETQTTKSASFTPSLTTDGTIFSCTGTMTITMPTATAGKSFTVIHATATSITWAGTIEWPDGTVPTKGAGIDIYTFYSDGTNWYGNQAGTGYA